MEGGEEEEEEEEEEGEDHHLEKRDATVNVCNA